MNLEPLETRITELRRSASSLEPQTSDRLKLLEVLLGFSEEFLVQGETGLAYKTSLNANSTSGKQEAPPKASTIQVKLSVESTDALPKATKQIVPTAEHDSAAPRGTTSNEKNKKFEFPVEEEGVPGGLPQILSILDSEILEIGAQPNSGGYIAYVPGGGVFPSALGDYVAAISNRFAGFYPINPGMIHLENRLVRLLATELGLPPTTVGVLASGGTTATISAIVAARDAFKVTEGGVFYAEWRRQVQTSQEKGTQSTPSPAPHYCAPHQFVVYCTNQVHGCISKALAIAGAAGVTRRTVRHDPTTFRMDLDHLRQLIEADVQHSQPNSGSTPAAVLIPWLVVASAGTVNAGAIDPLYDIGKVAHQYHMWYHVDGAYGGLLAMCEEGKSRYTNALFAPHTSPAPASSALSTELKQRVDGHGLEVLEAKQSLVEQPINRHALHSSHALLGFRMADSIVIDPHKALFLPYGTGVVLIPHKPDTLLTSHSTTGSYLSRFNPAPPDQPCSADYGLELSKHNRCFRLWFPLALYGLGTFRDAQSEKILLAQYFYRKMSAMSFVDSEGQTQPLFSMGPFPDLSIVIYRLSQAALVQAQLEKEGTTDSRGHVNGFPRFRWQHHASTLQGKYSILELESVMKNEVNLFVSDQVREDGRVFVTHTTIDGLAWLRICVLCFRTHKEHIDTAIDVVTAAARAAIGV